MRDGWTETTLGGGVTGGWFDSDPAGTLARVHGPATFGGAAGDGLAFRHSTAPAARHIPFPTPTTTRDA